MTTLGRVDRKALTNGFGVHGEGRNRIQRLVELHVRGYQGENLRLGEVRTLSGDL